MQGLYGDLYGEGAGHECQGLGINLNTLKMMCLPPLVSSNPKVMAAALVSGPHTEICMRNMPTTAKLDFLGFYQPTRILKPVI